MTGAMLKGLQARHVSSRPQVAPEPAYGGFTGGCDAYGPQGHIAQPPDARVATHAQQAAVTQEPPALPCGGIARWRLMLWRAGTCLADCLTRKRILRSAPADEPRSVCGAKVEVRMTDRQRTTIRKPKETGAASTPDFENVFEERDDRLRDEIAAYRSRAAGRVKQSNTTPVTDGDQ
jgi:hypothetical protein